jgi:hypothetical protein
MGYYVYIHCSKGNDCEGDDNGDDDEDDDSDDEDYEPSIQSE